MIFTSKKSDYEKLFIQSDKEREIMVVLDTDGLAKQDKEALDLKTLAADTPEVISRQVIYINY